MYNEASQMSFLPLPLAAVAAAAAAFAVSAASSSKPTKSIQCSKMLQVQKLHRWEPQQFKLPRLADFRPFPRAMDTQGMA
jgi:hypothetical protein